MPKKRLAVLFGGQSQEHAVSLLSAASILKVVDREKYEVIPVAIDIDGHWYTAPEDQIITNAADAERVALANVSGMETVVAGPGGLYSLDSGGRVHDIDIAFPVLHGPMGEDGTVQGLLTLCGIPFVGSDVLASAAAMDKAVAKTLMTAAGIAACRHRVVTKHEQGSVRAKEILNDLGPVVFVKPANMGSSIGVSRADSEEGLVHALREAFRYDTKVLIEEAVAGVEIEVAVLGNEEPRASVPGQVRVKGDSFYSYTQKYVSGTSGMQIPAKLSEEAAATVQRLAIQAYRALGCKGLARVDFFYTDTGEFLVNEVNTMPGFTAHSAYPKLWEASGLPYVELVDKLIALGLEVPSRVLK